MVSITHHRLNCPGKQRFLRLTKLGSEYLVTTWKGFPWEAQARTPQDPHSAPRKIADLPFQLLQSLSGTCTTQPAV